MQNVLIDVTLRMNMVLSGFRLSRIILSFNELLIMYAIIQENNVAANS